MEKRRLLFFFAIFTIALTQPVQSSAQKLRLDKSCDNGVCFREEDQGPCTPNDDESRLYRWEPIKVHMLVKFISDFLWLKRQKVSELKDVWSSKVINLIPRDRTLNLKLTFGLFKRFVLHFTSYILYLILEPAYSWRLLPCNIKQRRHFGFPSGIEIKM